jgi:hypothetical protein
MKNLLKISISFFIVASIISCNDRNEDNVILKTDRIKIDSVKIPQPTMDLFAVQTITTYSNYSGQCEGFYGYQYLYTNEFTRTVSSFNFKTETPCVTPIVIGSQINFRPQKIGVYKFRFYNGKDANGEPSYLEESVIVN